MTHTLLPCAVCALLCATGSTFAAPLRVHKVADPDDVLPPGTTDVLARTSLDDPSAGPEASAVFQFQGTADHFQLAFVSNLTQITTTSLDEFQPSQFSSIVGLNSRGAASFLIHTPQFTNPTSQTLVAGSPQSLAAVLSKGDVLSVDDETLVIERIRPRAFSVSKNANTFALDIQSSLGHRLLAFHDGKQLHSFARHLGHAPGFPAGYLFHMGFSLPGSEGGTLLLNEHAEVVFWGYADGPGFQDHHFAIWTWTGGDPIPVIIEGTPLPNTSPPLTPQYPLLQGFNNNGDILTRFMVGSQEHLAIHNIHTTATTLVASVEDPESISHAVLSSNGDVAFQHDNSLLFWRKGQTQVIASAGSQAPAISDPANPFLMTTIEADSLNINRRGQVVFSASVERNNEPLGAAIVGWDPQRGLSVLAADNVPLQTNDMIVTPPTKVLMRGMGFSHPMNTLAVAGDTDGRRRHLSDSGEVVFRAFGADVESSIYSATIPTNSFGDANHDNICDGRDLSVLLSNFGESVSPTGSGADFNADGIVNGGDLSILLAAFGT